MNDTNENIVTESALDMEQVVTEQLDNNDYVISKFR